MRQLSYLIYILKPLELFQSHTTLKNKRYDEQKYHFKQVGNTRTTRSSHF
ncbi:MAG: hypothetical protein ACJA2S_004272 [Cyclobacteriaceae bacterium]|jgi:hypothetical protein